MNLVFRIVLIFLAAQVLGVFTGYTLLFDSGDNPYVQSFYIASDPYDYGNAVLLFIYIIGGAALLLFIIRYLKSRRA
ncbi:hypothetical protein HZC08_02400 [Candidatus Micrarchaeota archaeon]|nr:hypothetical protein [Candidatus Micrarchaeota archaeon]